MNQLIRRCLFLLLPFLSLQAVAQEDIELYVNTPGTLAEELLLISPDAKTTTVKLKVDGYIDGRDMMFIRELCGVKDISTPTDGKLTQLDLSEVFVVESGEPYISLYGIDFTTQNDVFGCCFLYNCRQLEHLILPNTTMAVDSFALASCCSLKSLELPTSLQYIGYGALVGCESLESLTIPNSVDSIATGAFQKMTNLRELTLGNGITHIDNSLILGDDSLQVINFGRNFKTFHPIVFYTAPSLSEINVPYANPYLSSEDGVLFSHEKDTLLAFPPASAFTEYAIPDEVRRIGNSAFYGARRLNTVTMPDSLTTIDSLAFFNCLALERVEMGALTDSIAFGAFGVTPGAGVGGLTTLTLPASVSVIDGGAFLCNEGLQTVVIDDDNPWFASDEKGFVYDKPLSRLVYAPATATSFDLPSTVTAIGDFAATGISRLPEVYLNDDIAEIGTGAFAYSPGMARLAFGNGVKRLGDFLVVGCSALDAVYFFADAIADENIAPYAFLDEEGYVPTHCTLFVTPGHVGDYCFRRGFYSDEYEMSFFADIKEMESPDGIRHMSDNASGTPQYFSVDGKRHQSAQKGLNIVRLPEGVSLKRLFRQTGQHQ
ncbi:MAG: leucine-rich repeat protein [Prevotella sp.]|nr:leucine-rich repeat protein [Prevotella sp.]